MTRGGILACSAVLAVLALATGVCGRGFTRCDLAKELLRQGFPKATLREWVCMIEAESSRITTRKEGPHKDGSYNWGLFQINDLSWCRKSKPGGDCQVSCQDLLDDDITKAAQCALLIYSHYGFQQWDMYYEKCQYFLPNLSKCGIRY